MMRLKSKLLSLNTEKSTKVKVYSPANCEEVKIPFKADKTAKVVGKLAQIPPPHNLERDDAKVITGVLVQNDFKMSLMAPEDLREYAGLTTTTIMCKQRLTLSAAGIDLIKWALEGTFGAIEEIGDKGKQQANGHAEMNGNGLAHDAETADEEVKRYPRHAAFLVMGCVIVRYQNSGEIELEWEGNMLNDGIADAVLAVLFTVESSPAAVKRKWSTAHPRDFHIAETCTESSSKHHHSHSHSKPNPHADLTPEERFSRLCMFLEAQFGPSISPITRPKLSLRPKSLAAKPTLDTEDIKSEPPENPEEDEDEEQDLADLEAEETERLRSIGIPVPGVEIKVDKHIAKVWLETLEVECQYGVLRDRVKAVVERAVETVAPLWGRKG